MNKQFVNTAMGASRSEHAASIALAQNAWGDYATLHEEVFVQNGLEKVLLVNGEGAVVARNSKVSDAVKHTLYTNSSLRHEDFLTIQAMITEVRRRKLNGISDLQEAGLSFPVSIGDQIIGTENVNAFDDAIQEQNPGSFDANETAFSEIYVPNPITHKSFTIPWRQQGFAYKTSAGLKETMRKVAERLERTLFQGNPAITINMNGALQHVYGYTNHPSRGTADCTDWSQAANTDAIVNEVIGHIGDMFEDQGGVEVNSLVLYYPAAFKPAMDRDYNAAKGDKTVAERLLKIPEIKAVKFAEFLDADEIVYVELTDRTIQLAVASDIITVPHLKTNPMASQKMTTYAAMVQVIKVDSQGNTGILHCSVP